MFVFSGCDGVQQQGLAASMTELAGLADLAELAGLSELAELAEMAVLAELAGSGVGDVRSP